MVEENMHFSDEDLIATAYPNTSIILYHVSRLLSVSNHSELNKIRKKVIEDLNKQLNLVTQPIEKVILLTSLYRLNQGPSFEVDLKELSNNMSSFYWFRALYIYDYSLWIKKAFRNAKFMEINYRCEAYSWALLLELKEISKAQVITEGDRVVSINKRN